MTKLKKILLILVIASVIALFFYFGGQNYLTFSYLQNSQQQLVQWVEQSPILVSVLFFLVYVISTAFSLPGAVILTLAGGAMFGLIWGFLLISFASSLGATLAFLSSRHLLRDSIEARFSQQLKTINQGIEKQGSFYLFTLRLVPAVPFFVINLVMGLTKIKTFQFYWVSQLGMLAGTLVYVNAGTQLASLKSPSDILSPSLILSFTLLGLFPWLAKAFIAYFQKRKVYKKWQSVQPKKFDRNLVVIGAGAGGLVSSYIAAAVKAKVTLVETHKMGGDCLNYGCVPSKALIKSAKVAHTIANSQDYGIEVGTSQANFAAVMQRINNVITKIEPHDSISRYTDLGVDVQQGYARIISPWHVEISSPSGTKQILSTRSIVIATGASPFVPNLPGLDKVGYLTSDTLWQAYSQLPTIPKRIVILGGGPIGCELAQSFARLGAQVTQIEQGSRLMSREDEDVSAIVQNKLARDGVKILTQHQAISCDILNQEKIIRLKHLNQELELPFDSLICAVGRSPRLKGFGLEELGITSNKTIDTNAYLETIYPNIFAVGDVAGPYQLTHVAAHQAWYAAVNALFGKFKKFKADYSVIPWATFTDPEVARVGINEQEAIAQGIAYEVTHYGIDDLDRAIADGSDVGYVKVLTVPNKDKILGVTIVGDHAGDLIAEFVMAMKHGLGLNKLLGTIHIYPTMAEANKYAAGEWKRAHQPKQLLAWVERFHGFLRG